MEREEGTLARPLVHCAATSSTARWRLPRGVGQESGWCWVLLPLRTWSCRVCSCPLLCVGHVWSCPLMVLNSPTHVAGVRSPSRGGKVWGRARGPEGDRSLAGALTAPSSQVRSHLCTLGAHLHLTSPASSSPAQACGGQRLLQRHKRGIIARACGCLVPYFTHRFRQSSHPGAKSIQLFADAFL